MYDGLRAYGLCAMKFTLLPFDTTHARTKIPARLPLESGVMEQH